MSASDQILRDPRVDFPGWYQDVVAKASLAEGGPVRGTMVIRPYGYAIWERMQEELDRRIKATGCQNAYFPLFIPESLLRREAEHVAGFSPELAVVTHGGGRQLEEPVIVRPTSETIVNAFFSKWVQSHRDLPLLINQWANVVRWERRPRMFLRTTEFLWQEGHTAHASRNEAQDYAIRILKEVYDDFAREVLAFPVISGRKTECERFSGAQATYTIEGMMGDGKALQMGTSHELGQNFAKAFNITYNRATGGEVEHVWQTSWGVSTRLIGSVIMGHGDEAGLRLPPQLAPVQVVIVVVRKDGEVAERANRLAADLRSKGLRVEVDNRVDVSFGRRTVDWVLKGAPVRVELGRRELDAGEADVVRRDKQTREVVNLDAMTGRVDATLTAIQADLFLEALERRESRTTDVDSAATAIDAAQHGFARVPWQAIRAEEHKLNESGVSVRCLQRLNGEIPLSDDEGSLLAIVGRSY